MKEKIKKKNLIRFADGKVNFYIDMDGVLADFFAVDGAVERFENEKDFFKNLAPIKNNVNAVKQMLAAGINVYILSASPHERADGDKIAWLEKVIPEMPFQNIIIMRIGENKANYVNNQMRAILLDDYGKNCKEFAAADGMKEAYKIDKWHSIARYLTLIR